MYKLFLCIFFFTKLSEIVLIRVMKVFSNFKLGINVLVLIFFVVFNGGVLFKIIFRWFNLNFLK